MICWNALFVRLLWAMKQSSIQLVLQIFEDHGTVVDCCWRDPHVFGQFLLILSWYGHQLFSAGHVWWSCSRCLRSINLLRFYPWWQGSHWRYSTTQESAWYWGIILPGLTGGYGQHIILNDHVATSHHSNTWIIANNIDNRRKGQTFLVCELFE